MKTLLRSFSMNFFGWNLTGRAETDTREWATQESDGATMEAHARSDRMRAL